MLQGRASARDDQFLKGLCTDLSRSFAAPTNFTFLPFVECVDFWRSLGLRHEGWEVSEIKSGIDNGVMVKRDTRTCHSGMHEF